MKPFYRKSIRHLGNRPSYTQIFLGKRDASARQYNERLRQYFALSSHLAFFTEKPYKYLFYSLPYKR